MGFFVEFGGGAAMSCLLIFVNIWSVGDNIVSRIAILHSFELYISKLTTATNDVMSTNLCCVSIQNLKSNQIFSSIFLEIISVL